MDLLDKEISYQIHTSGCKVNTYDTSWLQKRFSKDGFVESGDKAKVHIFNTCAVTAEATKDAVKKIRSLKKKDPNCLVVVTGCSAQVDTDQFDVLKEADLVVANSHKGEINQIIKEVYWKKRVDQKVFKSNIFKKEDLEPGAGQEKYHTRTFLKIQDGCNSFCTFCVIPFARGKSRSLSMDQIADQVNKLTDEGVGEVVITGIHIGDYEDESKKSNNKLEDLVEHLILKTSMPRFRISSLEPVEVSDRLLDAYQDERLCPHFHMSIQSGNTRVLSDMKRKYGQKEVIESLETIYQRVPNVFVGMDVIVGFPGETEEDFQGTYACLKNLPWTKIHVFPYSRRPGTFADRIKNQNTREVIKNRATQLRSLSHERYIQEAQKQIGATKKVLILKKTEAGQQALSRDYWPIIIDDGDFLQGEEVTVQINSVNVLDPHQGTLKLRAERP